MFEGLQRGCETISISMRFYRLNIYVIRRSRDASVPRWLQIPFPHYAEIQWNPVSFRFIRGTLRTSLRSICLLRDSVVPPSMKPTPPPPPTLQVSWNARQHALDFTDNDIRNERFRYCQHSDRILLHVDRRLYPIDLILTGSKEKEREKRKEKIFISRIGWICITLWNTRHYKDGTTIIFS